jgi:hypothetical protein
MDINPETRDTRTWKETFISRNILQQYRYICPLAFLVR